MQLYSGNVSVVTFLGLPPMSDVLAGNLRKLCSNFRSVAAVCRKLGFNRQQFERYLTGETQPSRHNLQRIAQGFGVTVEALLSLKPMAEGPNIHAELSTRTPIGSLVDRAFPGDLRKLRPLLGYHLMHFLVPFTSGIIFRSLVHVHESEGKVFTKTVERVTGRDGAITHLAKYEGLMSCLGNLIFLVEFETISGGSIVETVLFPSYKKKIDILTGLTFGVTSELHRKPFASPIALKFLGRAIDVREKVLSCGTFSIDDNRIDTRIRSVFNMKGLSRTLDSFPL
jgi:transcriptional regulator with XRE-family HTH domain